MDNTAKAPLVPIKDVIDPSFPRTVSPAPASDSNELDSIKSPSSSSAEEASDSLHVHHTCGNSKLRIFKKILCFVLILSLVSFSLFPIIYQADLLISGSELSIPDLLSRVLFSTSVYIPSTSPDINHAYSNEEDKYFEKLHLYDPSSSSSTPYLTQDDLSALYKYKAEALQQGTYPIQAIDLSVNAKFGLSASNETSYDLNLYDLSNEPLSIPSLSKLRAEYGSEAPIVLILHTHGTESYSSDPFSYNYNDNCRTTDTSKNVVAVGKVMADYFNANGIKTIHCTKMFDAESYNDAYSYAEAAIREYAAIYPSIQYIFDIHRDSLIRSDNTKLRPVTITDGKLTAQFMSVIGTDEKAGTHTYWKDNLTFACHLQRSLNLRTFSLTRRMSVRSASYNQRYTKGSLLLEIGSCGNTLEEAKNCALIVAEEIAKIIRND